MKSPELLVYFKKFPIKILCDSGATVNLIHLDIVNKLNLNICKASQTANLADGHTKITIVGEVSFTLNRGSVDFLFKGLVASNLKEDALGGAPFLTSNYIDICFSKQMLIIRGKFKVPFGT